MKCMRVIYEDYEASFEELLEIDSSVLNHNKNLQYLAIELYKVFYGISQDIIKDVFKLIKDVFKLNRSSSFYSKL